MQQIASPRNSDSSSDSIYPLVFDAELLNAPHRHHGARSLLTATIAGFVAFLLVAAINLLAGWSLLGGAVLFATGGAVLWSASWLWQQYHDRQRRMGQAHARRWLQS